MEYQIMRLTLLFAFTLSFILFGCVSTQYEKAISVTKDANGNLMSTTVTERVIQPNQQGWPIKFEYLNGIQP